MERPTQALARFIERSRRLLVLTGAGCSTESGIPDYRDAGGNWKTKQPVQFREFVGSPQARQRYWARSMIGWEQVHSATPNSAHQALARLEEAGMVHHLITQNVDRLHQRAGSRKVIDLHGRLDKIECLSCRVQFSRQGFQQELKKLNPDWSWSEVTYAPDGDANLEGVDFSRFVIPDCPGCSGVLKPHVVFFGESVPRQRLADAMSKLEEADSLLVIGSSLMVWSGYRFARAATQGGVPVAAVNIGKTRADEEIVLKVAGRCGEVLPRVVQILGLTSEPALP